MVEVGPEHEGYLGLDLRLQQQAGRDRLVPGDAHIVEEHAGIRLIDAELRLHRRCRQSDLPADDPGAGGQPLLRYQVLDAVCGGDVVLAEQITDRLAWRAGALCPH